MTTEIGGRKIVFYEDLEPEYGIPFSKQYINELIRQRKFPKKNVELGPQTRGWTQDVIAAHVESKISDGVA